MSRSKSKAPTQAAASLCPSAQPNWDNSVAIGVVQGTAEAPYTRNFANAVPVTSHLLSLSAPVTPTEVFRFAAPCMGCGCAHFRNQKCGLVTQIVQILPSVAKEVPSCSIRPDCRWWRQEGKAACLRCPQVVTDNFYPSSEMKVAALPRTANLTEQLSPNLGK